MKLPDCSGPPRSCVIFGNTKRFHNVELGSPAGAAAYVEREFGRRRSSSAMTG